MDSAACSDWQTSFGIVVGDKSCVGEEACKSFRRNTKVGEKSCLRMSAFEVVQGEVLNGSCIQAEPVDFTEVMWETICAKAWLLACFIQGL